MPRISKVTDTFTKLEYGYLYDIQHPGELYDWFSIVRLSRSAEEFSDAAQCRELGGLGGHATKGSALAYLTKNTDLFTGMRNTLERTGRVFINSNGGFFGMKESLKIEDTRAIFAYILPSDKVRIIQWPGVGNHYYAKFGDQDVVVDGVQKWNTWEEAEAAALRFIQEGKL
jgi:hypothetical protein